MKKLLFLGISLLVFTWLPTKRVVGQSFSTQTHYSIPNNAWCDHIAIGDFNNDGKNDIVGVTDDYKMLVYLQDTAGIKTSPIIYQYPIVYPGARAIAAGDVNNDGLDDVVIGLRDSIGIFYQTTNKTFSPIVKRFVTSAYGVDAIKIGDVDQDGKKDIIVGSWMGVTVVFYQDTSGPLMKVAYPSATGAGWDDLEVGKLHTDSLVSIMQMGGQAYAPVKRVLVHTDRSVDTTIIYTLSVSGENMNGLGVGDFYGVGKKEMAVAYGGNVPYSRIGLWRNPYVSTSTDTALVVTNCPKAIEAANVTCGDRDQIVTLHDGWGKVSVITLKTNTTTINYFSIGCPNNAWGDALAVADVNGDGKKDIIVANTYSGINILRNTTPDVIDTTDSLVITIRIDTTISKIDTFSQHDTVVSGKYKLIITDSMLVTKYAIDSVISTDSFKAEHNHCSGIVNIIDTLGTKKDVFTTYFFDTVVHSYNDTLVTGIQSKNRLNELTTFPNPFSEILYVNLPKGSHTVYLMDVTGKIVKSRIGSNISFDRGSLPAGTYTLCVRMENGPIYVKKVSAQ